MRRTAFSVGPVRIHSHAASTIESDSNPAATFVIGMKCTFDQEAWRSTLRQLVPGERSTERILKSAVRAAAHATLQCWEARGGALARHHTSTPGAGAGPRGGGPAEEGTDMLTTVEKGLPHAQEEEKTALTHVAECRCESARPQSGNGSREEYRASTRLGAPRQDGKETEGRNTGRETSPRARRRISTERRISIERDDHGYRPSATITTADLDRARRSRAKGRS